MYMVTEFLSISSGEPGLAPRLVKMTGPGRAENLGALGDGSIRFDGGLAPSEEPGCSLAVGSDAAGRSALYSLRQGPGLEVEFVQDLGFGFRGGFARAAGRLFALATDQQGLATVRVWKQGATPAILAVLGEGVGGGMAYTPVGRRLYILLNRPEGGPALFLIRLDAQGLPDRIEELSISLGLSRYSGLCHDPSENCFYAIRTEAAGRSFLVQFDPHRRWLLNQFAVGGDVADQPMLPLQSRALLRVA